MFRGARAKAFHFLEGLCLFGGVFLLELRSCCHDR
jgi:hypothetical protein